MRRKVSLNKDSRKSSPWQVRFFGEFDPKKGKQRWLCQSFRLKIDAERFLAKKIVEVADGVVQDKPAPQTLGKFCEDWLKVQENHWSLATSQLYSRAAKRLKDYFGSQKSLREIDLRAAETFLSTQKRMDGRRGDLNDWSRWQLLRLCRAIFEGAVKWNQLDRNPFKGIKPKKCSVPKWHRITIEQYHKMLASAPDTRWQALLSLAFTAGLRLGELLSLKWGQIDFAQNLLNLDNQPATKLTPPFALKDHEARQIPLPQHTMDILVRLHNEADEGVPYVLMTKERFENVSAKWQQLKQEHKAWSNKYYVNNSVRDFSKIIKKAGIKREGKLSIHTLRKCCAQNWADNLPAVVTRELMGHSSITTTMVHYNCVDDMHRKFAAETIQKLLVGANASNNEEANAQEKTETDSEIVKG